jgi:DNA repair protein RadD
MLTPRWYQSEGNAAVWAYMAAKSGNPVVVLPTGAGKSLLIALLIQQALEFGGRVVVLAHRKELLQQNADEIRGLIPGIDVGIYSAGLKSREIHNAVVVAGIQSVFRKAEDLGRRHLVIVDEAHLISDLEESMYGQFLSAMKANDGLRIVGLTATPFRTGAGPICGPERIFQRVVFEAKTAQLIAEGFLCPITNKPVENEVNTDKVSLRGGEFVESEMQAAFDVDEKVWAACKEILEKTQDRHSVLIFASGVHHAEQIAETINAMVLGEVAAIVTGETLDIERSTILQRFKSQELRFLVNVDVLTTGFNAKCVDAIAILRATMSPGLFCQMVGRGLRLHESKTNCLLLDFGGNIARHGSIDDENFGRSQGSGRAGVAAQNGRGKKCPSCELDVSVNATVCPECNFLFPRNIEPKHDTTADETSQLTGAMPPEEWDVKDVVVRVHTKKDNEEAPQTVRVDYVCHPIKSSKIDNDCKYQCGSKTGTVRPNGPHVELICDGCGEHQKFVPKSSIEQAGNLATITIPEWVCPGHTGFARSKFLAWWDARSICDPPDNAPDAVALINMGVCRRPVRITTKKDGRWHRITECFFESEKPTELAQQEETKVYSGIEDDCPF